MKEMSNPPNTLQFAIASCAVQMMQRYQRQFYTYRGGGGKSRIGASIGLLVIATMPCFRKVRFVYSNQLLMEKDMMDFNDAWQMHPNGERVKYHHDLNFTPRGDEVVILDEGDVWIFKNMKRFNAASQKTKMIVLSATSDGGVEDGAEAAVLAEMDFKLFKNQLFKEE